MSFHIAVEKCDTIAPFLQTRHDILRYLWALSLYFICLSLRKYIELDWTAESIESYGRDLTPSRWIHVERMDQNLYIVFFLHISPIYTTQHTRHAYKHTHIDFDDIICDMDSIEQFETWAAIEIRRERGRKRKGDCMNMYFKRRRFENDRCESWIL